MPIESIPSQRVNYILVHDGYVYKQDQKIGEKILWRCFENKECPGRAVTLQNVVIESIDHNHSPITTKEVKKTENKKKEYATTTVMTTQTILGETSSQLPPEVAGQKPNPKCLKKTIQCGRKTVKGVPPNLSSSKFEIFDHYKYKITLDGNKKLLFNCGDSGLLPGIYACPDYDFRKYKNQGIVQFDIKIEGQKFLFKDIWYHRGQHVFLEGDLLVRFSAVICGMSEHNIWFLKASDNSKFRVHIDHFLYGEISVIARNPRNNPVPFKNISQV